MRPLSKIRQTFTRPWKINVILYRHREKDARLLEFKCVEFTEQLLYGDLARKPKAENQVSKPRNK